MSIIVAPGSVASGLRRVRCMHRFRDRRHAGYLLGQELRRFAGDSAPVVLALPRGGVPVAYEVARALGAPLDILVVRKLGVPGQEELAMGAVASGGALVINRSVVKEGGISQQEIENAIARERLNIERYESIYRGTKERIPVFERDVILVDDGLATGSTMRAAIQSLRALRPRRIIAAAPVGARESCARLRSEADEVICLRTPESFQAVGTWYVEFDQTSDEEVRELLGGTENNN
jgi:putative phosphoribosyl transferase